MAGQGYLADRALTIVVYLAAALEQPLLLEGEAGVGKTEVAKALAGATGARLIRLQCHEGIDLHQALYDWDYQRQLLAIRAAEASAVEAPDASGRLFSREFLLRRPLLEALEHEGPVVLLIDEIDRADDEFEAYLLEGLSEGKISIPEMSSQLKGMQLPFVVITSNGTRDIHEALRRRCAYHWIEHPGLTREAEILRITLKGDVTAGLAEEIAGFFAAVRGASDKSDKLDFIPGVSASRDVATAALASGTTSLTREFLEDALSLIAKSQKDQQRIAKVIQGRYLP